MKQTVKKFFKFELEEEALKAHLDECFGALGGFQSSNGQGINLPSTKSVLQTLSEGNTGARSGDGIAGTIISGVGSPDRSVQPIGNHGLKRGAQSKVKSRGGQHSKENIPDESDDGDGHVNKQDHNNFLPKTPSPNKLPGYPAPRGRPRPPRPICASACGRFVASAWQLSRLPWQQVRRSWRHGRGI